MQNLVMDIRNLRQRYTTDVFCCRDCDRCRMTGTYLDTAQSLLLYLGH